MNNKIIGKSEKFQEAYNYAVHVAKNSTNVPILLTGETGTGKEVFARMIHNESPRKDQPFVAINCANLHKELLESKLFGHTKGSFTSAVKDYRGIIRQADKGTLFLDEAGEMDIDLQAKLLRVLDNSIVCPLGSEKSFTVDTRIIAATNRNLKERIEEKMFREDLYYRLDVLNMTLPPLRERSEDIPLLIEHFIKNSSLTDMQVTFDSKVIEMFQKYRFPGNIRELKNIVEKILINSRKEKICLKDVPKDIIIKLQNMEKVSRDDIKDWFSQGKNLGVTPRDFLMVMLIDALQTTDWNLSKVAQILNISRQSIRTMVKKIPKNIPNSNPLLKLVSFNQN